MNEAYETCKRCDKVAGCFFLIISSVDRDMITKTVTFSIVEDFGFSMSPRDLYYQFHKNAPAVEAPRKNHNVCLCTSPLGSHILKVDKLAESTFHPKKNGGKSV